MADVSTPELLRKAADALADGEDPFGTSFLSRNEVSLDDCGTMADMLAVGARMVAAGIERPHTPVGAAMMSEMAKSAMKDLAGDGT